MSGNHKGIGIVLPVSIRYNQCEICSRLWWCGVQKGVPNVNMKEHNLINTCKSSCGVLCCILMPCWQLATWTDWWSWPNRHRKLMHDTEKSLVTEKGGFMTPKYFRVAKYWFMSPIKSFHDANQISCHQKWTHVKAKIISCRRNAFHVAKIISCHPILIHVAEKIISCRR